MAASERRQLQQELKQPDPFQEAILEAREYFENNRTQVLGIAGGALALFLAVVFGVGHYVSEGNRAASEFASAVSNLQSSSPTAAEADLKNITGRSNAGLYKPLAALYRGNIASEAGRYDEALASYDEFLGAAPTDYMRQIGLMGKASALELGGKQTEAATVLDLASAIEGPYRKAALSDRARLAEKAGDKAAAISNLQKLLEIEGSGPGAAEVETRIQALK
jgi:tetratricopeptide (TPR) repeat protein